MDVLFASPLCCHFDAPAWVRSNVAVGDDHSESDQTGAGSRGKAQHFFGHVADGAVGVSTLTQVLDCLDALETLTSVTC